MTRKYIDIVAKEAEGEDTEKLWLQCEQLEQKIGDNPANVLYSDKFDEVISYRQRVLEMERDKDDFLISIAGWKGETVKSLGIKTVADLFSLAERFNEELNGGRKD